MNNVPKLNYANLRGKSKSKDNQISQRKLDNNSSDLFSHMNQDNLKYIQNQIKQKNKKTNTIHIKRKSQQSDKQPQSAQIYNQQIQQKQSKYEQTQRQKTPVATVTVGNLKVLKTDGQSIKYNMSNQQEEAPQKITQQAQTHKLSYYDLVSQAKSKRVSSIQGYYQQDNQFNTNKQSGQFLTFLSGYIQDLKYKDKSKSKDKDKDKQKNKQKDKTPIQYKQYKYMKNRPNQLLKQFSKQKQKQKQKIKSISVVSVSSISQSQILKQGLAQQKMRNIYLTKQIEQHRIQQQNLKKRINNLQDFVTKLAEELQFIKIQLPKRTILQKTHLQNINMTLHNHSHNNNYNNNNHTQLLRPSHKKNNTSFSILPNQHNRQPQQYHYVSNNQHYNNNFDYDNNYIEQKDKNRNKIKSVNINNNNNHDYISVKNSRKIYNQEIDNLERQLELFKQTGQFKVNGRIREYD